MKIKWIAIIIALAVIVGGGVAAGIMIYNNMPENVLINSVAGMINGFSERDEIKPLYNMLSGGSLEIETEEMPEEENIPITSHLLSGKIYFSGDSEYMIKDLEYKNRVRGGEFFGDIYISDDFGYLREEGYLKSAYGVNLDRLEKELPNSIFAYGSGSKYAIEDKEEYERLLDYYSVEKNEGMLRELEKITEKYVKTAWIIFCENAAISAEEKELTIDGKTDNFRLILVRIKREDINKMTEDFYEFVKDDDSVTNFLDKYEEEFCRPIEKIYKIESVKQEWQDFVNELARTVDSIRSGKENQSLVEMINIQLVTPKLSSTLLQLSVSLLGEGFDGGRILNIDCGSKGIVKGDTISISSEPLGIELKYTTQKTKNRFISKLFVSSMPDEDDEESEITSVRLLQTDFDRRVDSFNIILGQEGNSLEIKGKYQEKFGKTTFNINSITSELKKHPEDEPEITVVEVKIKAVLKESDRMPSVPRKYKKISEITEEEMDRIDDLLGSVGFN